ncbi:FlgB family protein [Thalassobius sp. S69A]
MAHSMSVHAGKRQALIAQNIANADTPDYKPMDIKPFSEVMNSMNGFSSARSGELANTISALEPYQRASNDSPNGNAVSVEEEMVNAIEARRQHDQALAIYKSALNIMRSSLGRK